VGRRAGGGVHSIRAGFWPGGGFCVLRLKVCSSCGLERGADDFRAAAIDQMINFCLEGWGPIAFVQLLLNLVVKALRLPLNLCRQRLYETPRNDGCQVLHSAMAQSPVTVRVSLRQDRDAPKRFRGAGVQPGDVHRVQDSASATAPGRAINIRKVGTRSLEMRRGPGAVHLLRAVRGFVPEKVAGDDE